MRPSGTRPEWRTLEQWLHWAPRQESRRVALPRLFSGFHFEVCVEADAFFLVRKMWGMRVVGSGIGWSRRLGHVLSYH